MANAGKPEGKMPPSLGQLEQLHNVLKSSSAEDGGGQKTNRHSLDGRKAMIPIGTKAFYEGTLSPTIKSKPDQKNSKTSQSAQEHVLANIGDGYLAEMTTVEACSYIERRMEALRKLNNDHGNSALKADPTKDNNKATKSKPSNKGGGLKMKKGFLQSKSTKVSSKSSRLPPMHKPSISADDNVSQSLPFIEIREELDKEGNEIKSEALDVSKELLSLHRTIHSKKEESVAQNRPEVAGIFDALAGSVPQSIDSSAAESDVDVVRESSTEVEAAASIADNSSDSEERPYEEISARLDTLILLEEKEEKEKSRNKKSSKKLQGRWAKGFLSGGTSEKKKRSQPKKSIEKPAAKGIIPSKGSLHTSTSINSSKNKKSVKFGSDEIKEIPRIGTRSINGVINIPSCASTRSQIPTESTSYNSQSSRTKNDPSGIIHSSSTSLGQTVMGTGSDRGTTRKPSKSISIGGVTERASSISAQENSNSEPKKKLSRFAQRRLEQQEW